MIRSSFLCFCLLTLLCACQSPPPPPQVYVVKGEQGYRQVEYIPGEALPPVPFSVIACTDFTDPTYQCHAAGGSLLAFNRQPPTNADDYPAYAIPAHQAYIPCEKLYAPYNFPVPQ